jgi:hypothetical protein
MRRCAAARSDTQDGRADVRRLGIHARAARHAVRAHKEILEPGAAGKIVLTC